MDKKIENKRTGLINGVSKQNNIVIILLLLCSEALLLGTAPGCSGKKDKSISKSSIVTMDSVSEESKEIQAACMEIFQAYRQYGKKKIKEYLAGLPPFLQESSLSRLSTLSRYDDMNIVDIKKDTRVLCYKVKCSNKAASASIMLNIVKDPSGSLKLVGIN